MLVLKEPPFISLQIIMKLMFQSLDELTIIFKSFLVISLFACSGLTPMSLNFHVEFKTRKLLRTRTLHCFIIGKSFFQKKKYNCSLESRKMCLSFENKKIKKCYIQLCLKTFIKFINLLHTIRKRTSPSQTCEFLRSICIKTKEFL